MIGGPARAYAPSHEGKRKQVHQGRGANRLRSHRLVWTSAAQIFSANEWGRFSLQISLPSYRSQRILLNRARIAAAPFRDVGDGKTVWLSVSLRAPYFIQSPIINIVPSAFPRAPIILSQILRPRATPRNWRTLAPLA